MINGFYSCVTPRGTILKTIYTPVHAVFEDIRRVTGVDTVCLPDFEHAMETELNDESPYDTRQTRVEPNCIPSSSYGRRQ